MNRRFIIILVLFIAYCTNSLAQMPDSVKNYIDLALNYMQTKSLYSKLVDWDATKDSAYLIARDAKNYKEAFPAIAFAFQQQKIITAWWPMKTPFTGIRRP